MGRPCFCSPNVFLFCWAAFLSISLLASVFPVSLPPFFLFLRPCLIHVWMPEWGRAFVHGHTFLHSWSGSMMVVVGLLQGATFLSNLPLVLFVSFKWPSLSRWNGHSFNLTSRPCAVLLPVVLSLSCVRRDIARSEASRTTPPITYLLTSSSSILLSEKSHFHSVSVNCSQKICMSLIGGIFAPNQ